MNATNRKQHPSHLARLSHIRSSLQQRPRTAGTEKVATDSKDEHRCKMPICMRTICVYLCDPWPKLIAYCRLGQIRTVAANDVHVRISLQASWQMTHSQDHERKDH